MDRRRPRRHRLALRSRTATALRLPGSPASVVLTGSHLLWTTGQDAPIPSAAPDEIVAVFSLADTVHLLPLSALAS
ncbi:hypothetical protein EDD29_1257 [Actinocorallia herbida]|uniref:Uncharacterized protein n=1 Tax=Actinocorallia herbida TaxID=58109 RepID=A0A3N1CSV2_9ACTN|nr:hypothetical protein [Actinocorallia herbida]ROO83748.1 hypothetical protein EDD29_1257 [Actinocorallia herbida]